MLDAFRLLVVLFLLMHGLGHLLYFLAAWTSVRTGFGAAAWSLPGQVTIRSPLGRAWGIAAIVVTLLFALGAAALLLGERAWVAPTNVAVFLSFGVVVPWWRQAPGSAATLSVVADLVIMFLLALPLSVELTTPAA